MTATAPVPRLIEQFERGLDAPICPDHQLTYACNLACVHRCPRRAGATRELSTAQCKAIIDELERMQVFYVNIGGGEPTVRPDFLGSWWTTPPRTTSGVKFSTNGVRITAEVAARLAASDYVDVQISLDGATAGGQRRVRGPARSRWRSRAGEPRRGRIQRGDAKISVVVTRHNVDQLDDFKALADRYSATLRITRMRPSGPRRRRMG